MGKKSVNPVNIKTVMLRDPNNKFAYSAVKKIVHDRNCNCVQHIPNSEFRVLTTIDNLSMNEFCFCTKCYQDVLIRNAVTDSVGIEDYADFMSLAGASPRNLKTLLRTYSGKMKMDSDHSVIVQVKDDRWRISLEFGELVLYHNNYTMRHDYSRTFLPSWHEQYVPGKQNFENMVRIICAYDWDSHVKKFKAYDRSIRLDKFRTNLAITDNAFFGRGRTLLSPNCSFVGTDYAILGMLRYIPGFIAGRDDLGEGYSLISCRVPRLLKKFFMKKMQALKDKMLKEERFEYIDICETNIPQVA